MEVQMLRNRIQRIEKEISRKEGEMQATLETLKKEFKVKTIDEAYDMYDDLKKEIETKQQEKERLIEEVDKKLTAYGY
jgi:prefoldin subunit 5